MKNLTPTPRCRKGRLTVVGTGIRAVSQLTAEAEGAIRECDKVFYLVQDAMSERVIRDLNPRCESLLRHYRPGRARQVTYSEIVRNVLRPVRRGLDICMAFYGHPGVFANPGHEAIRQAREEGHEAEMLAGVSSEDCLFADLGIDPGHRGCQSFEATDFLVRQRRFDTTSHLVLWQVGALGVADYQVGDCWNPGAVALLAVVLGEAYGPGHEVVIYEAPVYPLDGPRADRVSIQELGKSTVTLASTLYVPPVTDRPADAGILARLRSTVREDAARGK